jgi:ribosomal protein L37AE/L43A
MSERAQPFHCPYCGDENLFPREGAGAWECRSCLRSFTVQMTGMIPHPGADPAVEGGAP